MVYVQVGETVTLKAPAGNNLQKFYLYWTFEDNFELAWRNNNGGKGFTGLNNKLSKVQIANKGTVHINTFFSHLIIALQVMINGKTTCPGQATHWSSITSSKNT